MDFICYLHPGWKPLIRPAEATRDWMNNTPEAFAYRCLPLNIANAHGWEILSPCSFDACWTGNTGTEGVIIRLPANTASDMAPVSIFGQGVLTFHVAGLFRTPPGWNLWVGGSPNRFKDGIEPLTGVVETDWSPFTFTMNWRFTRPNTWVHFDAEEPMCFVFPVQRNYLEAFEPKLVPMESAPEIMEQFKAWSRERDAFHERMLREPPKAASDKWQKHYYRGVDVSGKTHVHDHTTKLRLSPFVPGSPSPATQAAQPHVPAVPEATAARSEQSLSTTNLALRKREWLLDVMERQRELSPNAAQIERRHGLSREEFLERYYAPGRPVILTGEMDNWPSLKNWSPSYLKEKIGTRTVEYQGGRTTNDRFEMYKDTHKRTLPFDQFIDLISRNEGNDAYITAYNSGHNQGALSGLHADLGFLDKFLRRDSDRPHGMMWIGPAGTVTSLHHDLTNNFIAQIVGSKRLKLIPAADVGKLYNHKHVFSGITDIDDPAFDRTQFPLLANARIYDVVLKPGEIIYVPIGWWHQVKSLDFSVTITYTNFLWPNDGFRSYPSD